MKNITMVSVESSQLQSAGYDENLQDLYIEFKNGTVYRYYDVPQTTFHQLEKADSPGSYFAVHIKGKFEYKKLDVVVDNSLLKLSN
jgi:hypothetical protein